MNTRQIIAKNLILQISLQLLNLWVGTYTISLIARYLGPTIFGKYGFVTAYFFFFMAFLDFGFNVVGIRELSRLKEDAGVFLGKIITFKLFVSIILVFVSFFIVRIYGFPQDLKMVLILYSPVLIFVALESAQMIIEARLRFEYIVLSSFIWRIVSFLFIVIAVRFDLGLVFIIFAFLSAELSRAVTIFISARRLVKFSLPLIDKKLWMTMLRKAIPIGITSLLITSMRNIDVMLLAKLRSFAETGLYLIPVRVCDMMLIIPLSLIGTVFPLMSNYYKHSHDALRKIYQKTFDLLSFFGIFVTVLIFVLAGKIIITLFGREYLAAVPASRILIFSALFIYLGISSGTLLIVADKQKINMWIYIICAPINIILNLFLIPQLGIIGSAISNITVMFIVIVITFYFVAKEIQIALGLKRLLRAVLAGLITAVALFFAKDLSIFISAPVGFVIYAYLAYLFQAISFEDVVELFKRNAENNPGQA